MLHIVCSLIVFNWPSSPLTTPSNAKNPNEVVPPTHPDPKSIFGTNVRRRRQAIGLSQEALADACGLHRTYVGAIERGERNLGLLNVVRLSRALLTSPSELVRGIDDNQCD